MIKIYFLVDLMTQQPFYVGASKQLPESVCYRHYLKLKKHPSGFKYVTIDSADTVKDAAILEEYWYWQLKSWGFQMENYFVRSFKKYKPSVIYLENKAA